MENNWELQSGGNEMLRRDGFKVSYNAHPTIGYEGQETALIHEGHYYILIGDFRKQYEACKDVGEALEFFRKNLKHKGSWSEEIPDLVPAEIINQLKSV